MFWRKKAVAPPLSREESLKAVVVPVTDVEAQEKPDGTITLAVPFRASRVVERLAQSLGARSGAGERRIELDELGTFVWRMCDGRTTVRQMIERLAARYQLNRKDAEVSLTTFVRTLAAKGLAAIVIPKSDKSDDRSK